jgi:hypothetical protein
MHFPTNNLPSLEELDEIDELETKSYMSKPFGNDEKCSHHYVRVSPTRVECTKCHSGLYDTPDKPIPIKALNEYYSQEKTKEYNKWL